MSPATRSSRRIDASAAAIGHPAKLIEGGVDFKQPNDALVRITTTTICGTDVHILKGEYPVAKGLTVGHEPVGVIEKLGSAVQGYQEGQRVIAGAICPSFTSYPSQDGVPSQDGAYLVASGRCGCHGYKATGGWRFGNLIDGTQAEYVLVPDAQANLAPIPDDLTDEQALRVAKPGGTLSSLGVYSSDLTIPVDAFAAGLGDHRINTALCPGGKERMRRLMNVIQAQRLDLGVMVTHHYKLDDIVDAYELFAHQRDGVLKVAVKPS